MFRSSLLMLAVAALALGCEADSINAADMSRGDRTAVLSLGITTTPITADQAKAIAEKETGGTAIEVEAEEEDGVDVFEVEVRVGSDASVLIKEVLVRAIDGAVLGVEVDDEDDDAEDDDEPNEIEDDRR